MGKCLDGAEIVTDTIALTLDLVGFKPGSVNDYKRAALKIDMQKALRENLKKANKDLTKTFLKGKPLNIDDANKAMKKVGLGTAGVLLDPAKRQLSEGLGCAWSRHPVGMWVDENNWVMYIIAPVVIGSVAAGSAYMYHAKVGDKPAAVLTALANPLLKEKKFGSLTLGASDIVFKPSERTVEAKVYSNIEWKPLNIGFSLFGGVKNGEFSKGKMQSQISYKGSGTAGNLQLGLKTFIDYSDEKGLSHGFGANATLDTTILGRAIRFGAEATWTDQYAPSGRQTVQTYGLTIGQQF